MQAPTSLLLEVICINVIGKNKVERAASCIMHHASCSAIQVRIYVWQTLTWETAEEMGRIIWWSKEYISESFRVREWRRLGVRMVRVANSIRNFARSPRIDGDLISGELTKKFANSISKFSRFWKLGSERRYQDPFQSCPSLRYFSPKLCASWEWTYWLFKRLRLGVNHLYKCPCRWTDDSPILPRTW